MRWLPMVDLPQHELLADALVRHASEGFSSDTYSNYFTYNLGFELAVAGISSLVGAVGVVAASHLVTFLAAVGLIFSIARFRSILGLDYWPALLASLLLLNYSAAWGFANFTLGLTLAFVALGDALRLRRSPPASALYFRALFVALALAATHVLATLTACAGFALLALPSLAARPSRAHVWAWLRAGLPLMAAALYDIAAFFWARHHRVSAWENTWAEGRHLGARERLASIVQNTLGTRTDGVDKWILAALAVAFLGATLWTLRPAPKSPLPPADGPIVTSFLAAGFAAFYLVIPTVFVATFYVGERFASVSLLAAIATFSVPKSGAWTRIVLAAASAFAALRLESTVRLANDAARDGLEVLAALPASASVLPVHRNLDVEGLARSPLRHLFARHALRAGAPVGYSFLRFESPPVRRKLPPSIPDPPAGFEADGLRLDLTAPWARAWDVLFVIESVYSTDNELSLRDTLTNHHPGELALIAHKGRFFAYRWANRRAVETR